MSKSIHFEIPVYRVLTWAKSEVHEPVMIFGTLSSTKSDDYFWNCAWCYEWYDRKVGEPRVSKDGRGFWGKVNEKGIRELQGLGYNINYVKIELEK